MTENKEHILSEHKTLASSRRSKQSNLWMISTFVLLIAVVLLFAKGNECLTGFSIGNSKTLTENTAAYINTNVLTDGSKATISDATKVSQNLYEVTLNIGPQKFKSYVTADGKYLFPSAINMGEKTEAAPAPKTADVPKTDKPVMDMFVMSQCPYGVQAEDGMLEVAKLLGNKIKWNIYYIANSNADGTFSSLHGQPEVDEDMRQVCIASKSPDKLYVYLTCINADYRNAGAVWEKCAATAGIDPATVKTCIATEGKQLLADNVKLANDKGVGASPTIELNGVSYKGSRSADGFKTAICSAFKTAPEECSKALSSAASATTGGCGA